VTNRRSAKQPGADGVALVAEPAHWQLLGRGTERELLASLVQRARHGHGAAVVIRGEPGIGKSALVDETVDGVRDFSVYWALGVESEMELPYAGLQQLCEPVLDHLAGLPSSYRTALETALGRSMGSPPDRFLVGMAVFELVRKVAELQPLMWVLDRSSAQTIGFVGRRLRAERVVLVIAARDVGDERDFAGLPVLQLSGLGAAEAGKLFDSVVTGPTDPIVRDRIISETRGNPLALLELPRAWTTAELVEGMSGSDDAPLGGQLELAFAKRVAELPPETQILLTLAAAETRGDPALLWAAAQQLGLDWSFAAPAEREGLIEFGQRVCFRHPLVRAAAYRAAPIRTRLDVHRALAEVTDPVRDGDRRAWHRASSTVIHDEGIATELEHSADRAKSRGSLFAAAAFLDRAAYLTPDGARRANRMLAAAQANRGAGALDSSLRLLSSAETHHPPSELRSALVEQLRGRIAFDQRRASEAAELLLSAARRLEPLDARLARDALLEALAVAVWVNGPYGRDLVCQAADAARAGRNSGQNPSVAELLLSTIALRITTGHEGSAPAFMRALAAVRSLDLGVEVVESLVWLSASRAASIIAIEAWDFDAGIAFAERQVEVAREAGALIQVQTALNFMAEVVFTGDARRAAALIEEERQLSVVTQMSPLGYSGLLLGAFRGDAATKPMISAMIDTATKDGQARTVGFAHCANAILCNAVGRHEEALDSARRVLDGDVLGYEAFAAPELAEAASRTGDAVALAEISAWMRARAGATPTEWSLGIAALVQALEAGDARADALYQESIRRLSKTSLRVALARSRLLYGEWLRRQGRRGEARDQLDVAHEELQGMGIEAFAKRARRELTATTGRRTRRSIDAPSTELTGQELQIARLVQGGLSNREIGSQLFLSPRTIEWHLRNIFGKLGVSARRELRDKSFDL
jgi:DNA-binding CsgD family transcriptional regulator